jgi:hypothetical protein
VLVEIFIILLHARYHAVSPRVFSFSMRYLWVNAWRPKYQAVQPGAPPARAMRPNVERVPLPHETTNPVRRSFFHRAHRRSHVFSPSSQRHGWSHQYCDALNGAVCIRTCTRLLYAQPDEPVAVESRWKVKRDQIKQVHRSVFTLTNKRVQILNLNLVHSNTPRLTGGAPSLGCTAVANSEDADTKQMASRAMVLVAAALLPQRLRLGQRRRLRRLGQRQEVQGRRHDR